MDFNGIIIAFLFHTISLLNHPTYFPYHTQVDQLASIWFFHGSYINNFFKIEHFYRITMKILVIFLA